MYVLNLNLIINHFIHFKRFWAKAVSDSQVYFIINIVYRYLFIFSLPLFFSYFTIGRMNINFTENIEFIILFELTFESVYWLTFGRYEQMSSIKYRKLLKINLNVFEYYIVYIKHNHIHKSFKYPQLIFLLKCITTRWDFLSETTLKGELRSISLSPSYSVPKMMTDTKKKHVISL